MSRRWRMLRHLSAVQIAHRLRLRLLARTGADLPVAGPVPPLRDPGAPPLDLLRPCSPTVVEARAREVAEGRFRFLEEERELGLAPFPAPSDASLLWAYQLEYMDYLQDLAACGRSEAVASLVASRLDAGRGLRHPYPVSRRVASWVRALGTAEGEVRANLARGAWGWAGRVLKNLEYDVGGNHLLENGLALVLAGTAFRGRRAAAMRARGRTILFAGARDQILPDGGHFELSPMYHARVLTVLAEGATALEGAGEPVPPEYWEALGRMVAFLGGVLHPDGRIPLLGDSVHEETLEPDLLVEAVERRLPLRSRPSRGGDRFFPDTGIAVLRDAASGHQLVLDAGPTCPDRLPAHGQADTFTYELSVSGVPLVVDSGVFEYAAGEMRDFCRSTQAHATVTVDDRDSSEVWSSFRVGRRARVRDGSFRRSGALGTWAGRHDGYRHLGVAHRRTVSHLGDGVFLVLDGLRGPAGRRYVSRIPLHPGVEVEVGERGAVATRGEARLTLLPFGPARLGEEAGWHCPRFGVRSRRTVLRLEAEGGTAGFGYLLFAGEGEPPEVRAEGGLVLVRFAGGEVTRAL